MEFIKIGDNYFNTGLIGWKEETETEAGKKTTIQFVGGREEEIVENEQSTDENQE